MRRPALAIAALLLLAVLPAAPRWLYGTWDTCTWLGTEAAGIAWQEAGLPEGDLPDTDPVYDWSYARWEQLVWPYESEGRCLAGWARLRFLGAPPVVRRAP